jgi:type III restriction enzyme
VTVKNLYQEIVEEFGLRSIFARSLPDAIEANLNPKFAIRPYQKKALQLLDLYTEEYLIRNLGIRQLLFHMATGSGKTLIMAGAILNLYRLGFRNFLFFVDSTSIINKTRDNFLNKSSSKHLFSSSISIDGQPVQIQEVDNFQASNPDAINIVFTTIQGLHTQIRNPRENALTIDDFRGFDIVLISDEAHHINADTRQHASQQEIDVLESPSWENTVESIFNANPQNILLEFTATMDFDNAGIADKYIPRLIFDYPLREFRMDGYSKEVTVLQTETEIMSRALGAIVLSQWRRKIFADNRLSIKPVVLFKARTIKESEAFQQEFQDCLRTLSAETLLNLKNASEGILTAAFEYLENSGTSLETFAMEIQEDFSQEKQLSVNSKSATENNQIILNSLEDRDNEFRAIFAVDMLNEGWDVLNLFDIVRLYDTRDAKANKVGKTTMSEAQLIGRGARYFPFKTQDDQEIDKRKFDSDIENPLRLCESLVYHSAYNPRYIQELNSALREIGLVATETVAREMTLKASFRDSATFKNGMLFVNALIKKDYSQIVGLESYLASQTFKIEMNTGFSLSTQIFENEGSARKRSRKNFEITLSELNRHVIRKAINKSSFFTFQNLKEYLPNLSSIDEFISNSNYFGGLKVSVDGPAEDLSGLNMDDQLDIALSVCADIETRMRSQKTDYVGSTEFKPVPMNSVVKDKVINIANDDAGNKELGRSMSTPGESTLHLDLGKEHWFSHEDFFGTSEEKHLIHFFKSLLPRLEEKFSDVLLIRNERFFKIYNFADGAATEPDFLAILRGSGKTKDVSLQVFIEPKGDHLLAHDKWKEDFLIEIKSKGLVNLLLENEDFKVWGMPFYNKSTENNFKNAFEAVFDVVDE